MRRRIRLHDVAEPAARALPMPIPQPLAAVRRSGARRRPLPPLLSPWQRLRRVLWIAVAHLRGSRSRSRSAPRWPGPSNSSFTIRRSSGCATTARPAIASQIESIYYSLNAPSTGGPGAAPAAAARRAGRRRAPAGHHPADPARRWPARACGCRPRPGAAPTRRCRSPSSAATRSTPRWSPGVAWIDPRRTSIVLYPGRLEPSVTLPRGPMEVPPALRSRLLATFNSGFKLQDSHGGFARRRRTPTRRCRTAWRRSCSYTDGRVDIEDWASGARRSRPASTSRARTCR